MRIGPDHRFDLTYCTNVHPGEDWATTSDALKAHLPPLKAQLSPEAPFGVGLRLSNKAARELLQDDRLSRFKAWLDAQGLYVFTINGFPYGHFHQKTVKDRVYAPDWRTRERVEYTLRLVHILAELLPAGMEGSISTSPLSYKPWLDDSAREDSYHRGSLHLADVAAALVRLRERTGTLVHVDLEPEPDCLLENADETASFFEDWLLPVGGAHLSKQLGTARENAESHLLRHVRACYDACHFAVEYEEPAAAFARLKEAQVRIGKVHLSAALQVPLPRPPAERQTLAERLHPLAEATYLHQVIERRTGGALHHYADLPAALEHIQQENAREWRIHYHVPIFVDQYAAFRSTQRDIVKVLDLVRADEDTPHLEIETYTWAVLPPNMKLDGLLRSIRREYEWVLSSFGSAQDQEGADTP